MFSILSALFISSLSILGTHAHGYVQDVVVGSTHYTGYLPYTDPYYNPPPERIIRKIPGNGAFTILLKILRQKLCESLQFSAKAPSRIFP